MKISMIVTYLDGTLLRKDKSLSLYTLDVLKRSKSRGIHIVFATARPVRAVNEYMVLVSPDSVIYHNGAVIYHSDKTTEKWSITNKMAKELLFDIRGRFVDVNLAVEAYDKLYADFDVSLYWHNTHAVRTDFRSLPEFPVDKIIVGVNALEEAEKIAEILPEELYMEISENRLCMIMNKDAGKFRGIERIAAKIGIPIERIAAFGDDFSDVLMVKKCGTGIAMANGIKEVKDIADHICGF